MFLIFKCRIGPSRGPGLRPLFWVILFPSCDKGNRLKRNRYHRFMSSDAISNFTARHLFSAICPDLRSSIKRVKKDFVINLYFRCSIEMSINDVIEMGIFSHSRDVIHESHYRQKVPTYYSNDLTLLVTRTSFFNVLNITKRIQIVIGC